MYTVIIVNPNGSNLANSYLFLYLILFLLLFQVDTVKRMCIKKLPRVLAIQLKRFDYDWER